MHILDHLRKSRAISALANLGRCINALDDYMKTLRLDDPMRDTVYEVSGKMSELYDSIKERKNQNND